MTKQTDSLQAEKYLELQVEFSAVDLKDLAPASHTHKYTCTVPISVFFAADFMARHGGMYQKPANTSERGDSKRDYAEVDAEVASSPSRPPQRKKARNESPIKPKFVRGVGGSMSID